MTVTAVDKLLATIGIGLWVTLIACAVLIFAAIRRNNTAVDAAIAYETGWTEGVIAALNQHGPGTDQPEERLLWIAGIDQIESNPYRGAS